MTTLIDNKVHANGGGATANVTNNITVHVHVYPATEPVLRKLWRALHGTGRHRAIEGAAGVPTEQLSRIIDRQLADR